MAKVTVQFTDMTLGQRVYCKEGVRRDICLFDVRVGIDHFKYDAWFGMQLKRVEDCNVLMKCFNVLIDILEQQTLTKKAFALDTVKLQDNPSVRFCRARAYPDKFLFCVEIVTREGDIYNGFIQMVFTDYEDILTLKGYFEDLGKETPTPAYNVKKLNYQERLCQSGL